MRDQIECFENRKKSLLFIAVVSHLRSHIRFGLD